MTQLKICVCVLLLAAVTIGTFGSSLREELEADTSEGQHIQHPLPLDRDSKFLNLQFLPFIVVKVPETVCAATSGGNGTCLNKQDCSSKGGKGAGKCANGYGVCCLFEKRCGAVVKHNMTYLVSDDYPNAYTGVGNCQYIIEKVNRNICQLRLELETLSLAGPDKSSSMCEEDTFTVVGTAGENPRVICGENSGQHMYVDLASGTASARINIATTTQGKDRSWRIRVLQIPCNSVHRAPAHCLQYHSAYSGTIESFNYQTTDGLHQIGGQSYTICIKTREGFCAINYKSNEFSMSENVTATPEALDGNVRCTSDFVSIFVVDKTNIVAPDRYCGTAFNDTITFAKPFQIRVMSDEVEPTSDVDNKGFSLKYMQIPC